jgi:nitroimidazol reductase NimA-like FMN-containing flavoprotein (pyridoxamine 5'-phosphate oxidase superfamily)
VAGVEVGGGLVDQDADGVVGQGDGDALRPHKRSIGPTPKLWSPPTLADEGLELLTEEQARDLLARGEVGRIGITIGALPAIFPVNYRLLDGAIVFRTSPGSKLSAATEGAVVAFEVDDYQLADRTGWSVLAVGQAELVHDVAMTFKVLDAGLEPLAGGRRSSIVRIKPTFLSGRRIVHGDALTPA